MSGLAVDWLDVFTDVPFTGNPLAVLPDADELSDQEMQAIAAELGLSETVFVLGGAERLRIFTPSSELPLAGHPVVGTTLDLVRLGRIAPEGSHSFATGVGETVVEVADGVATMTQAPLELRGDLDPSEAAGWLGLEATHVVGTPRVASTVGWPQAFVQVRDRETLAGIEPDLAAIGRFEGADAVIVWADASAGELAQRFFGPRVGIAEDPATGAAGGALAALRVHEGAEPGELLVRQGHEIGRPSEIRVSVGGAPGAPEPPRVGGRAVLVMEGRRRAT